VTGRWSISRRLALLYAVSSFVMLSLATAYLYWSLSENLEREGIRFSGQRNPGVPHDFA
jgi:hypothetical protein